MLRTLRYNCHVSKVDTFNRNYVFFKHMHKLREKSCVYIRLVNFQAVLRIRILIVNLMWIRIRILLFTRCGSDPTFRLKPLKKRSNSLISIHFGCHLQIDADPDPAYYFDTDPHPIFLF
jgi:hypothetical protein